MTSFRFRTTLLLCAACCAPALAQDFKDIAPKQPAPQAQPGKVTPPAAPPATPAIAGDPAKVLLPTLKGLKLVARPEDVVRDGVTATGVTVTSLPLLTGIDPELAAFVGKPLTVGDLNKITQVIVAWYRAHKRPVVEVSYPEQNLDSGVLQAVVSEYRVGKVTVRGNRWFSSEMMQKEMGLKSGDPIDLDQMRAGLDRLNANPFRGANAVMVRSDVPGATDIDLKVDDRLPLRLYTSYDNTGLPVTGRERYSVGLNWGNAFGWDDQFSYQFSTSPDLWRTRNRGAGLSNDTRFQAHSATYSAPLAWGDTLSIFGSYVQQVPDLGPDFGQVGHSAQVSARYQMPLQPWGTATQALQFGFDYKRSDNNLAFGGASVFASTTEIDQFLFLYDFNRSDTLGYTAFENTLVASPGGLTGGNNTATFLASGVAGAKAAYVYDNLSITRLTQLPWDASWIVHAVAQVASSELLPSEQLGAGGVDSVRGYDPRVANGSQGFLASTELRTPAYSPLKNLFGANVDDHGQLLAFYDLGYVAYKVDQQNLPGDATLQSLGIGARYSIGRYLEARFDYGWQLQTAPGATHRGNLANISVTLAY